MTAEKRTNNFVIDVATVNGSGSQSANNILVKSIFRTGLPVAGKNLFPSNIQGLPTWFTIRVSEQGYVGNNREIDIKVAMNISSMGKDISSVKSGGLFIYNDDLKFDRELLREDLKNIAIPFRKIVAETSDSIQLRKLLTNMAYVGVLGEILKIDKEILTQAIQDQFSIKPKVIESNLKALEAGWQYAKSEITEESHYEIQKPKENLTQGKILIDGNTAAGMGLSYSGCTFAAWYPITPSSSLMESFIDHSDQLLKDQNGKKKVAIVQAEDELSSITMVAGAGWAGSRAVTATSGPGLSLMAETAGLCYFAEIPAVIWDVQRAGPSTGLPTRTMQCDVLSAVHLSHGDTKHPVLLPGSPQECFEFAKTSLDLAETLQTLVIVLSDLDLGMNLHITDKFQRPHQPLQRGKVLTAEDLERRGKFARYLDEDGDGIAYRTLPGTEHDLAAYFTRGTGHDSTSQYSEDHEIFKGTLDRLQIKWETARQRVPRPIVKINANASVGLIAYGSSDSAIQETQDFLKEKHGINTSYLRLRAIPFTEEVEQFINTYEKVFVIDQNRDGQMHQLLKNHLPEQSGKLISLRHYDGLALDANFLVHNISQMMSSGEKV